MPLRGQEPPADSTMERFHPALLHSLLVSLRRFEPELYAKVSREHQLDAERISGLFAEVEMLGPGPLSALLAELRQSQSYGDIVYLAGRNAFVEYAEQNRLASRLRLGRPDIQQALRQHFTPFVGQAIYNHLQRGEVHFLELRGSLFARHAEHEMPLCGFYCGFLMELGQFCSGRAWESVEQRCCAADLEAPFCLLQFAPDR
jgi:hypothetical protein